jgi:hypothetical protein
MAPRQDGVVQSAVTTVVTLVGAPPAVLVRMGSATNVDTCRATPEAPALERATEAWAAARRSRSPYFIHDADPLAWVVEAWAARFDGHGTAGELEMATSETLGRWRAGSVELPDYYILVGPDDWGRTVRHWYLGVLASESPARVVVSRADDDLTSILPRLGTGPWWPKLETMVRDIDHIVPDRARLEGGDSPRGDRALFVGTEP